MRHGIYMASKTKHAPMWRDMRQSGVPINSTWIYEAGAGESACLADLWLRCIGEAVCARALVVYREPDEVLKGAFIEVGAALAVGIPIFAVGCDEYSFTNHPLVTKCATLSEALLLAEEAP